MVLIQFFPLQISKVVLPYLTMQKENIKDYKSIERSGLIISILIRLFLVIISLIFDSNIIKMYKIDYPISKYAFRIMMLAALFSIVNLYLGQSIIASGKAWRRTLVDIIISISMLITFLLVYTHSTVLSLPITYCFSFLLAHFL